MAGNIKRKLDDRGRIHLPKVMMELLELENGGSVIIEMKGKKILIKKGE